MRLWWIPALGWLGAGAAHAAPLDSDGDGIADIDEDTNGNGIVDSGETDPHSTDTDRDNVPDDLERRLGTDPTDPYDVPPIPEPMYIDLIRNLGSRRGELEVNVLATTRFDRSAPRVAWGPEIEWVVAKNFAVELELPMHDGKLDALKGGFQTRIASLDNRRFEIGVLAIGHHELHTGTFVAEPSAVFAVRFTNHIHGVTLVGPTAAVDRQGLRLGAMLHPSVFWQLTHTTTLGLELGQRFFWGGERSGYVLPQVHLNISPHAKLQLGFGASTAPRFSPLAATRLSFEF